MTVVIMVVVVVVMAKVSATAAIVIVMLIVILRVNLCYSCGHTTSITPNHIKIASILL
jgi:hypothetical protein